MVAVEKPGKMRICNLNTALERAPGHTPATAGIVPGLVKTKKQQNSIPDTKAGDYLLNHVAQHILDIGG